MIEIIRFKENFKNLLENVGQKKILLAVSGGVDSMVLLNLFQASGFEFHIAHVNYHFREEDSDMDQKLVENYCKKHNIKFHLKDVSENEKSKMKSLQNWAREIRYDFFFEIIEQENLDFIVTAHHLNDELETFLINLSRGSGIKGLSGIPKSENRILRPLLNFSKTEIYNFAQENNLEFREDLSNQKNDYLRNKIRNQLTPKILEIFPDFLEQFQESIHHLGSVNQFYQNEIEKTFQEIFIDGNDDEFILNKEKLSSKPKVLVVEIIRKLGFSGLEIEKIINAENGKFFRSNSYEIRISRKEILCSKRKKK